MKLHKLTCPNCNGSLDMEIADGTPSVCCPYCGQTFLLDDEKKEITINKNININKTVHKRYTNDAKILHEELEYKKDKRNTAVGIILGFGIPLGIILAIVLYFTISSEIAESQGKIQAGYYKDLIGQNYKAVEAHFEAAGFTDIELIDLNDAGITFWNNDKVANISVGGDTDFESVDWFDPDTKVVISYH